MAAELLIMTIPLIAKAIDRYLQVKVPQEVSLAIQSHVEEQISFQVNKIIDAVNDRRDLYLRLSFLSMILSVINIAVENSNLYHAIYFLVYVIPTYLTIRTSIDFYRTLTSALELELTIKKDIEDKLKSLSIPESLLVKIYEKRSVDDLAKFTAGTIVFQAIASLKKKKNDLIIALVSYCISILAIIVARMNLYF